MINGNFSIFTLHTLWILCWVVGWLVGVCCYLVPLEFIHKEKQLKYIFYIHTNMYSRHIWKRHLRHLYFFGLNDKVFFFNFYYPSHITIIWNIFFISYTYDVTTHSFSSQFSKPINHFHNITLTLIKMKLIRNISKTENSNSYENLCFLIH